MPPIRKLAFVINAEKEGASDLARALVSIAEHVGVKVKQTTTFPVAAGYLRGEDACCVIGGDGTLLGVAREAALEQGPITGKTRGTMGFLTTYPPEEARAFFAALLGGPY